MVDDASDWNSLRALLARRRRMGSRTFTLVAVAVTTAGVALATLWSGGGYLSVGVVSSSAYECGFVSTGDTDTVPSSGGGVPANTVYFNNGWGLSSTKNASIVPRPSLTVSYASAYGTGGGGYEYMVDELAFGCMSDTPSTAKLSLTVCASSCTTGSGIVYAVLFIDARDVNANQNPGSLSSCAGSAPDTLSEPQTTGTNGPGSVWAYNMVATTGFIGSCTTGAYSGGSIATFVFSACWLNPDGGYAQFSICDRISFAFIDVSTGAVTPPTWTLSYTAM